MVKLVAIKATAYELSFCLVVNKQMAETDNSRTPTENSNMRKEIANIGSTTPNAFACPDALTTFASPVTRKIHAAERINHLRLFPRFVARRFPGIVLFKAF